MLADNITRRHNGSPWQCRGELFLFSVLAIGAHSLVVIKPQTFMNRSGAAVAEALSSWETGPAELIVAHDDLDLPTGKLRVRPGGGHGGHNGIRSIVETLGTGDFARIKLGVGRPLNGVDTVSHVLGEFRNTEWLDVSAMLETGADAVQTLVSDGAAAAMNLFNGK